MSAGLVFAEGLGRSFAPRQLILRGRAVPAVVDVSLSLAAGEAVGLVGESGSGKSTIGRLLLGLLAPTEGRVVFDGIEISGAPADVLRRLRRRMQLIFQDPYASLDPRRRVGAQIAEGLLIHGLASGREAEARARALLQEVGLPAEHAERYPQQFSGGQRQRIGIARALATGPDFLVADEPVSALDVSVQAQVLALLGDLCRRRGLTLLFISHDLPVVRHLCARVVVLYLGRVMEEGRTEDVFAGPRHPYTRALLAAAPRLDPGRRQERAPLAGELPSPADPPSGCVFRTRCAYALPKCAEERPVLREAGGAGHRAACIRDDIGRDDIGEIGGDMRPGG
ncbi:MAG TPA: oligopeptide/dipeptide ABC transporter ATP-binding protein [Acetobacteraceae bacterium]|nr:oligopeptide/dipeptide ABC transporter ATP-binding protein [Acetobacteraceae bacterium]